MELFQEKDLLICSEVYRYHCSILLCDSAFWHPLLRRSHFHIWLSSHVSSLPYISFHPKTNPPLVSSGCVVTVCSAHQEPAVLQQSVNSLITHPFILFPLLLLTHILLTSYRVMGSFLLAPFNTIFNLRFIFSNIYSLISTVHLPIKVSLPAFFLRFSVLNSLPLFIVPLPYFVSHPIIAKWGHQEHSLF